MLNRKILNNYQSNFLIVVSLLPLHCMWSIFTLSTHIHLIFFFLLSTLPKVLKPHFPCSLDLYQQNCSWNTKWKNWVTHDQKSDMSSRLCWNKWQLLNSWYIGASLWENCCTAGTIQGLKGRKRKGKMLQRGERKQIWENQKASLSYPAGKGWGRTCLRSPEDFHSLVYRAIRGSIYLSFF